MSDIAGRKTWPLLQALLFAMGAVLLLFLWQGRDGFNLGDEGFLWYGAQRVAAGEVPLRDFQSYDPSRYYWAAAGMSLGSDNGIILLRVSVAAFQVMGLAIGLATIGRTIRGRGVLWCLLATVTLAAWMFPRHKLFDASISLALIGALTFLLERPLPLRYFLTGLCLGLSATFGRNHGLYGMVGSLAALFYLAGNGGLDWRRGPLLWVGGIVAGYTPVLLLLIGAPGFADSFWSSITFLFDQKATNFPLPVPWPWLVPLGQDTAINHARALALGAFFVAILAYGCIGGGYLLLRRQKKLEPGAVATFCLALPYAHFAFSRADVGHLALGIFPFIVGSLVLLATQSSRIKWTFGPILAGVSLLVMLPLQPGWQKRADGSWAEVMVGKDRLWVPRATASAVALIETLVRDFAPGSRAFLATPYWPGAYALADRKAPTWEIYPLFPRREAFERKEIERLEAARPTFALVLDAAMDGHEQLRFARTHPFTQRHVSENFEAVTGYTDNPAYQIFRAKPTFDQGVGRATGLSP